MTKIQKIILMVISILLIAFYAIFNKENHKINTKERSTKSIVIEPLVIEPKEDSLKPKDSSPSAILAKLEEASHKAKVSLKVNKEEEALNILAQLKEKTKEQLQEEAKKEKTQKEKTQKVKVQKIKKIKKAKVVKKVQKKQIAQKSKVKKKKIVKKEKHKNIKNKNVKIAKKSENKSVKKKKIVQITKEPINTVPLNTSPQTTSTHKLSREEEVAAYHRQYANKLEVVSVSKPFQIEEKPSPNDATYFEPIKPVKENPNAPLKFVKKLGVVEVSNPYESNFNVPKKVELAAEGVVDLPSASVETEEMKRLKFVEPLEVVEVSPEFESLEAKKYIH